LVNTRISRRNWHFFAWPTDSHRWPADRQRDTESGTAYANITRCHPGTWPRAQVDWRF
jgi:hypothetical protein